MRQVQPVLIGMEAAGFCVDTSMLKAVGEEESRRAEEIKDSLLEDVKKDGVENFNLSSAPQKSEYIFSRKLKKDWKTEWSRFVARYKPYKDKTGQEFLEAVDVCFAKTPFGLGYNPVPAAANKTGLSVDKDAMVLVERANLKHPRASTFKKFLDLSKKEHFISTYIEGIQKAGFTHDDGRFFLHPTYNQSFVVSGRLSCSNPNMQNWPRAEKFIVREAVRSRFKGGHIIKADQSQIEPRVSGWYYDILQMREDYEAGRDMHAENAKYVYGPKFTKEDRTNAKVVTFKNSYGGTPTGVVNDAKIPIWEYAVAKELFDVLEARYPEWNAGREEDIKVTKANGYLDAPSGFRFDFRGVYKDGIPMLRHYSLKNVVANYPIQHTAAVLMYCALIVLHGGMKSLKSVVFSTVHDDVAVDVYPGEEKQVTELLTYALTDGMVKKVNEILDLGWDFPVDVEVSEPSDYWV